MQRGYNFLDSELFFVLLLFERLIKQRYFCYYSNWYPFEGTCQNRFLAYEIEYEIGIMNFSEFDEKFIPLLGVFFLLNELLFSKCKKDFFFDWYFYRLIKLLNSNNIFCSFYISSKRKESLVTWPQIWPA